MEQDWTPVFVYMRRYLLLYVQLHYVCRISNIFLHLFSKRFVLSDFEAFGLPIVVMVPRVNCSYTELHDTILGQMSRYVKVKRKRASSGQSEIEGGLFKLAMVNENGSETLKEFSYSTTCLPLKGPYLEKTLFHSCI